MRRFEKPSISVADQIGLLKQRGLRIHDEPRAKYFLESVSFFRLSPYMRPFQIKGDPDHNFEYGIGFRELFELYEFDRRLRLLVMDAIERVEVAVRALISNHMGPTYGAHWYVDRSRFKNDYDYQRLLDTVRTAQAKAVNDYKREIAKIERLKCADKHRKLLLKQRRAQESYARHYALTYEQPELMPNWAMMEEITLGDLSYLYKGLAKDSDRKIIAKKLEVAAPILESWLHTLTTIRNLCAHHARFWNRELGIKPMQPKQEGFGWPIYLKTGSHHTRVAVVLAILQHLMKRVSPHTKWEQKLIELLGEYPEIPRRAMGLPDDWDADPFWGVILSPAIKSGEH